MASGPQRSMWAKYEGLIGVGAAAIVLAIAGLALHLVGAISPEQREWIGYGFAVLPVAAVASILALAFFLGRGRVGPGVVASVAGTSLTLLLAVVGIVIYGMAPVETTGEAVFHPTGGRVGGGQETVRFLLPEGHRFRYGRQSWREGEILDAAGTAVLRVSLDLADDTDLHRYAADRLLRARERSPAASGGFRAGPRGEEWLLEIPWPDASPAAPPRVIQIARRWRTHVLALRITASNPSIDPRLLAETAFASVLDLPG